MQVNSAELPLEQFDDSSEDRYAPWEWAQGIPGAQFTTIVDVDAEDLSVESKEAVRVRVAEAVASPAMQQAAQASQ